MYDVAIRWDLPRPEPFADLVIPASAEPYLHIRTGEPLVDWFTKDEYERYLDELAMEPDDVAQIVQPVEKVRFVEVLTDRPSQRW